jgi:hypothetical protein
MKKLQPRVDVDRIERQGKPPMNPSYRPRRPYTLDDYDHCVIDGAGHTQDHPEFDPTVEGPHWRRK